MPKPIASVSFDLDNLWSYQKTHGDPDWERRGTYLQLLMPPLMEALDQLNCKITFFIVGSDAVRDENLDALRMIPGHGHEVGNHTFEHDCWLHLYSRTQLEEELARAEQAIFAATGQRPTGFRGPGFSWSPALLEILEQRGYLYDASTLPTYIAPLARAYFLFTARLDAEERKQRQALFGSFRDGFRPVKPYMWQLEGGRRLLEIPVTTLPVLKIPFHLSYLIYLSRYSEGLMLAYLRAAIAACRMAGVQPSFLLHPLDLLGGDQVPQLAFFPGMNLPGRQKVRLFTQVLRTLGEHFTLVPMGTHAVHALAEKSLGYREPALAI